MKLRGGSVTTLEQDYLMRSDSRGFCSFQDYPIKSPGTIREPSADHISFFNDPGTKAFFARKFSLSEAPASYDAADKAAKEHDILLAGGRSSYKPHGG